MHTGVGRVGTNQPQEHTKRNRLVAPRQRFGRLLATEEAKRCAVRRGVLRFVPGLPMSVEGRQAFSRQVPAAGGVFLQIVPRFGRVCTVEKTKGRRIRRGVLQFVPDLPVSVESQQALNGEAPAAEFLFLSITPRLT